MNDLERESSRIGNTTISESYEKMINEAIMNISGAADLLERLNKSLESRKNDGCTGTRSNCDGARTQAENKDFRAVDIGHVVKNR